MQRLDIGAVIRVSLGEVPERVVPGHVVQQLNVPVPVSCLKLMHHKDEILLTNVLSGKPRTEKRQCGQKLSRGVQSLLIVCALRSEKKLVGHLGPQSFQRRESIPDVAQGSGEGIGFVSNLAMFGWKHAVVIGQFM